MPYSEDHIALAAEYVLGTLEADERALVETMMIVDQGFKELVEAWDRKLAPLHQMVGPVEPPDELWDKIKIAAGIGAKPAADLQEAVAPEGNAVARPEPMPVAADASVGRPAEMDAGAAAAAADVAAEAAAGDRDAVSPPATNVVPLPERKRFSVYSAVMTAIAASLAGVVALQAYRPDVLPEALRIKPEIRTVEVKAPPSQVQAQFVAVLQQDATRPAFILTVDTATRQFTVRRVSAEPEPNKSYELWLVSDRLPQPRSLGVIGDREFTARSALQAYDPDVVSNATYAVTIEPKGGSPTGVATGPIVYTGKLVESVPAGTTPAR
ncbi:anti-sigma factor [Afipia sp. TerB]